VGARNPAHRQPAPRPPAQQPNDTARLIGVLAAIVVTVVVVAIIIVSLQGNSSSSLTLQQGGFSTNASQAINQLQSVVSDNQQ